MRVSIGGCPQCTPKCKAKEQAKKFSKARSAIKMAHKSIEMSSSISQDTIDKAHEMIAELEKMCIIHLFTLGYRESDLLSFKLALNNPSKIAELQELEHLRTKFDNAAAQRIKHFEATTNHDVKAVEYFIREEIFSGAHKLP